MKQRFCLIILVLLVTLAGCRSEKPAFQSSVPPGPSPWTNLNFKNDPDNFQFAIVADRTGGHRPGIFGQAVDKLNLLQPEFVMCVGDLIEGNCREQVEMDRQWDEFENLVNQLQMPFFHVPGNHDISNPLMVEGWRQRFGPSYYHFVYRDVLFLCVDTEDPPKSSISEKQVVYLAQTLAQHPHVRWTCVFLHEPFWTKEKETNWPEIEALLQDRPYTVFAGHHHAYAKRLRHGRRYINLATTGGISDFPASDDFRSLDITALGDFDHILWVTMTDNGPLPANLLLDGIYDENIVTDQDLPLVRQVRDAGKEARKGGLVTCSALQTEHDLFTAGSAEIKITNPTDLPLSFHAGFQNHPSLRPFPYAIDLTIPAQSERTIQLSVRSDEALTVDDISPLIMEARLRYQLPARPPVKYEFARQVRIERIK